MAHSPLAVRPLAICQMPPLLELDITLSRIRRQESAAKQAAFWNGAALRAAEWSQKWTWEYSPHVIELGEDLLNLALREVDDEALLRLTSTCRCLRGLLLPRLLQKKARAVRNLYLSL